MRCSVQAAAYAMRGDNLSRMPASDVGIDVRSVHAGAPAALLPGCSAEKELAELQTVASWNVRHACC